MTRRVSADEAVRSIESGQRVFVHGGAATPQALLEALVRHPGKLEGVETVHLHLDGDAPHVKPEQAGRFRANAFFVGDNVRAAVADGRADYLPISLSEIPSLFDAVLPLDVALLHVSPPDRHGFVSLGVSVDIALAAARRAKRCIAQVNPRMPRTLGDGLLHESHFAALVDVDAPLPEAAPRAPSDVELAIGRSVAGLVEDGATLQMGIGAIPDAVLAQLAQHRRLGVHTEMFSDGLVPLIRAGAVTGEAKARRRGKVVTSFVRGSRALYDFVDDNPFIELRDSAYVNDPSVIRQNPNVTAINSALEVDLTGQVCADSLGERIYSGVGGQADFMRGASLSTGGKPIIALPATTRSGASRIVAQLQAGAGVVTPRAQAHWVVTEYGVAQLHGKNLRQRAQALVAIAHPSHREALSEAARRRFGR